MKKIISSCILGAAALSAVAAESSVTFTYAGDEFGSWGKSKSEIYDVAIRISDPALVGKKITSIRALLNADKGIESTSVWLSKELTLEKVGSVKVTVPDTYAAEVEVESVSLPGAEGTFGQLSSELETPYVLTEEGIYVGYSLTVPSPASGQTLTDGQKSPLLISPCSNPESLYLRASKDFLKWIPYNDKLGCAAMIYVTLEGEFSEYSLGIKSIPVTYAKAGEDFLVKATVSNIGSSSVSKIGYAYSIAGQDFNASIDLDEPIVPDFVNASVVEFPIAAVSEIGEYDLSIKITEVNGNPNESAAAAASAKVSVLPFVPVHRPMLEEFTGTWCGWCTRGYWALETLSELYGDAVVLAAYHDGDPMAVRNPMTVNDFPVNVSGFPSSTLNRNGIEDPYYGNANNGFGMKDEVAASMETAVPAAIDVEAVWADTERNSISVKATATFVESIENAGYKVGYLLINNGLTGDAKENAAWAQSNYFAQYASQYVGTDLEVLTKWPAKVMGLVFNDVVVDITGMKGVPESIPSDVAFNTPYENEFSFDISANSIIQDKDKLYVAAFIISPDGTILNANKAKVGAGAGAEAVSAEEVAVEYYNLSGAKVTFPAEGIYVKVSRLSDGSVRTSKVVR